MVHSWRSSRKSFVAYLLPNGNLIRDGNENDLAVAFRAGGAAGWIEEAPNRFVHLALVDYD